MRLFTVLAVLTAGFAFWAPSSASAEPLCETVWTDGTILGSHTVVNYCLPYPDQTICTVEGAGAAPQANLYFQLCTPALVIGPSPIPTPWV